MAVVWVTGNSGVGKSTACDQLTARGYAAFDADHGYCFWVDRRTGRVISDPPEPTPDDWLVHFGWYASAAKVKTLTEQSRGKLVFLCGSVENKAAVENQVDLVICLVADDQTLIDRLASRTQNTFGRKPDELAAVLQWNPQLEGIYRSKGAVVIDATLPVGKVVDQILASAHARLS
jgi:adenylate kinase family enzyme